MIFRDIIFAQVTKIPSETEKKGKDHHRLEVKLHFPKRAFKGMVGLEKSSKQLTKLKWRDRLYAHIS